MPTGARADSVGDGASRNSKPLVSARRSLLPFCCFRASPQTLYAPAEDAISHPGCDRVGQHVERRSGPNLTWPRGEFTRITCPVPLPTSLPRSTVRVGTTAAFGSGGFRHSLGPRSAPDQGHNVIRRSGSRLRERECECYPFVPEWNLSSCQQIPGRAGAAHVWPAVWAKTQSSAGAEWASAETTSWTAGAS